MSDGCDTCDAPDDNVRFGDTLTTSVDADSFLGLEFLLLLSEMET